MELLKSKTMDPVVSIIVPIYNIEDYLPKCLDSIISQTYPNFELILVDDGSTDSSWHICDRFAEIDNRIKVIHKKNGGLTSARNAGLLLAQGDWIMHVDGDDWIDKTMLQSLITAAETMNADLVQCNFRMVWDDKNEQDFIRKYDLSSKVSALNSYISSTWTTLCASMAKKELYDKYALRSPNGIAYSEDFHLSVRLWYYAKKIVVLSSVLYNYRQQGNSIVHNFSKQHTEDEYWVYSDTISFFKRVGMFQQVQKSLHWRLVKSCQELLLDEKTLGVWSERTSGINGKEAITCPFVNRKIRVLSYMMVNKQRWFVKLFLRMRAIKVQHNA